MGIEACTGYMGFTVRPGIVGNYAHERTSMYGDFKIFGISLAGEWRRLGGTQVLQNLIILVVCT